MDSNPILQQLRNNNSSPSNLQIVKNLMRQIQGAPNAQQLILNKFPNLQPVLNLAQNRGYSLEQIARMMAQQKGVDINALINELSSL